jgi:hypothetical protein
VKPRGWWSDNLEFLKLDNHFAAILISILVLLWNIYIFIYKRNNTTKCENLDFYKEIIRHTTTLSPTELKRETDAIALGYKKGEWNKIFIFKKNIKYQSLKDKRLKKMIEKYIHILEDWGSPSEINMDWQTTVNNKMSKQNEAAEQWQKILKYCEEKTGEDIRTIDH